MEEKSIRQIPREFKCSRPTVRKAIASAEVETYTLTVPRLDPVLGPYKECIQELLAGNEQMPRKQLYTSHKIYKDVEAKGHTVSEI